MTVPDLFEPLHGIPCWGVKNFHGSMFMLEFGQPRLVVGEPTIGRLRLENGPDRTPMRQANPVGEWTLEILYCEWAVHLGTEVVAHCETPEPYMARALRFLEGQALTQVAVDQPTGRTAFWFDLGAVLTTSRASDPYGSDAELWTLLGPGKAWSLTEDGTLSTGD